MTQLRVTASKLNKRSVIPASLPQAKGIIGTVNKDYTFEGTEVMQVPNAALGKWYQDRDNSYYWGGALMVIENLPNEEAENNVVDHAGLETSPITPIVKKKIEQVINAFETGTAQGIYHALVKYKDYTDPATNSLMVQVTYGRSQTTEFGHLKALVKDYVNSKGTYATVLSSYLDRVGRKPSLATDDTFCTALFNAGKNDPIMKRCQDELFELKYYQPAYNWFITNGFTLPLSMLVIYDSTIHSGGILSFLRNRFSTVAPVKGGDEKEWIKNYLDVRNSWLANHSNPLLRKTVYRTQCLLNQVQNSNWDISQSIKANGVTIS